ncbi:MAG TPA: THUMP domain-containing protein [Bacteroidales bacterium]|nr:THUMP domain-containing protein [Bacteroidales bacterium]HPS16442.1 THUMP domain-containing protein [Bacteroidales bacterium]
METNSQSYIAKTISGLENVLAAELNALGASEVKVINRAVSFSGDTKLMYTANLWLRTALRILEPVSTFRVNSNDDLYNCISDYPWESIINVEQTLAVDAFISNSVFNNSQFVAQKVKDAVVDRFRKKFGKRPSVSIENPDLRINVHITQNNCNVSLDTSGESLHKRGYRKISGQAPLSEVLAAGLILLSGWDKKTTLVDPMCGSGTILTEAALIAENKAPGIFRNNFGFMNWKNFNTDLWKEIFTDAKRQSSKSNVKLFGYDISQRALEGAAQNAVGTGLQENIKLERTPFEKLVPPVRPGTLLFNPPYGERIQKDDIVAFYKTIGDIMKQRFSGFEAWLISSDMDALKHIGLKPSAKYKVFNGPLECRFVKFNLYEGSKKRKENSEI